MSKIFISPSWFKSAESWICSPTNIIFTTIIISCIFIKLSPLISPNENSKVLKICHPAIGCETVLPEEFVVVIK